MDVSLFIMNRHKRMATAAVYAELRSAAAFRFGKFRPSVRAVFPFSDRHVHVRIFSRRERSLRRVERQCFGSVRPAMSVVLERPASRLALRARASRRMRRSAEVQRHTALRGRRGSILREPAIYASGGFQKEKAGAFSKA
jgi:hypothetical protein